MFSPRVFHKTETGAQPEIGYMQLDYNNIF
jgi:hypothetical protein